MDARMDAMDAKIEAIHKNTDEIVEFFKSGKGFFRVVRGVGFIAKWIATVAAGVLVLWALAKLGVAHILDDAAIGKR